MSFYYFLLRKFKKVDNKNTQDQHSCYLNSKIVISPYYSIRDIACMILLIYFLNIATHSILIIYSVCSITSTNFLHKIDLS